MNVNMPTGYTKKRLSSAGTMRGAARTLSLATFIVCITFSTNARASITGTLYSNSSGAFGATDTSGGLTAINAVVGQLTWTVDRLQDGTWKYTYQVIPSTANKPRGIGSFNVQFGQQPADIASTSGWGYTYVGGSAANMGIANTTGNMQTIDRTLANTSEGYVYDSWLSQSDKAGTRVNVTTTFQGLAWIIDTSDPNGSNSVTLELTTTLAPMWGNIYMDGYNNTTNNGYGMMRNTNYDSPSPQTFSLTAPAFFGKIPVPGSHILTLGFAGTGGGSVSGGISCSSASACDPLIVTAGTPLTLIPSNDANSFFAGWSGGCTNGSGNCDVSMNTNQTVTAIFNAYDKIRIGSTPYTKLSDALAHAGDGPILARAMTFSETLDVTVDQTKFQGGFDTAFSGNSGQFSTLQGTLTISTGSLTVEGLVIS
ncbi:MAG: hypothetical protein HXX11_15735 [Desulfuromonadales bacterium]|nr:hypothetical protein [Desulfuromonadales bacterium]